MSDIDKFQECLDCSGCSGDCGQGCENCSENKPSPEAEVSVEATVDVPAEDPTNVTAEVSADITAESVSEKEVPEKESSEKDASDKESADQCKEVEINPMDLDEVAEKTEDLRPKIDPSRGKLDCFNYLADIPGGKADYDIVEVQFKNTRKGFYRNTANLDLKLGDMVAVESQPGHDIGRVTLVGHLVRNQMKKAGLSEDSEIRKIFRFARESDMEKYYEAKALEIPTMIGSRQIAAELGLKMKIGDVEYQGDGLKAIFYYIADERVDFRQLIKILAERFKIRVEMRQIGARQEAGRIGGIGPCGRPLCCSTWMTNFVTVATSAARHQDLSLNPQKLAGQCAKLKCCLNFEIDTYLESVKKMPPKETRLDTLEASWYHFKTDIFKGEITYSSDKKNAVNTVTITAERAFEIIEMNSRGEKPLSLIPDEEAKTKAQGTYNDILGDDSQIGRFDKKKKKKKKKKDKEASTNAAAVNAASDSVDTSEEDALDEIVPEANSDENTALNSNSGGEHTKANERSKSKPKNNKSSEAKLDKDSAVSVSYNANPSSSTTATEYQTVSTKDIAEAVNQTNGDEPLVKPKQENVAPQNHGIELNGVINHTSVSTVSSELNDKSEPKEEKEVETTTQPAKYIPFDQVETSADLELEESSKATKVELEEYPSSVKGESGEQDVSSEEADKTQGVENSSEHKHHHQNHHHHPNHDSHDNRDNNGQGMNADSSAESADGWDQNRRGNNPATPNSPTKPQWQGKNQGKGFKPQQGKGQEQFKNRESGEQGKMSKPQQGKSQDQFQHQHGQQARGQQGVQQPQGKEPYKAKGQNQSQEHQDRHANKDNQGKVFKPQRQGDEGHGPETQGHQGQVQNPHNEDSHPHGGSNFKKKKNKKPHPQGQNAANSNQGSQHGDQTRPNNQGSHNHNRPQQGPRPSQNQAPRNQNPANGNE